MLIDFSELFHGTGDALVSSDERISYEALPSLISRCSALFDRYQLKSGDLVGCYGASPIATTILFFSAIVNGLIFVPLNHKAPYAEEMAKARRHKIRRVFVASDLQHLPRCGVPVDFQVPRDRSAAVIFTSGSTAAAKAVVYSLDNFYHSARGTLEFYGIDKPTSWLCPLPLFHIGGLMIVLRMLLCGGTVFFQEGATTLFKAISTWRPAYLSLVPTQLIRLLEERVDTAILQEPKAILIGGAAPPLSLLKKCRDLQLPISLTYGSSESTSQTTALPPGEYPARSGEVGKALAGREVTTFNGRIAIRGRACFTGYLDQGVIINPFDNNGWFNTNDLGSFNTDGGLILSGRNDDLFMVGGETVSPHEIEAALATLDILGVLQVVPIADTQYGARPALVIWSRQRPSNLDFPSQLGKHLTGLKIPRQVFWADIEKLGGIKPARQVTTRLLEGYVDGARSNFLQRLH